MSPTARTLKLLKDRGHAAGVVERYNSFTKQRHDLLGCIDIVAAAGLGGVQGWQATSDSNLASRVAKAIAEPRLKSWLAAGGRFYAIGWGKKGARGERKVWKHRIVELRLVEGEVREHVCDN